MTKKNIKPMNANKALFLDRDGVINVNKDYVYKIQDFEFTKGIFDLLLKYQEDGYLIIIITNQSGIGRGYYTEDDFNTLTEWMTGELLKYGITILKTYYCPYHPTEAKGKYLMDSNDRKPNPGMIYKAQKEFNIDLAKSVLIGDSETDVEAGRRAGVGTLVNITAEVLK